MPPVNLKRILAILLLHLSLSSFGQLFPVQVTPQLVPPYSVYLSDYATPGNEKLRVIILQRDLSQPSYQLRLVMSVEWNGKIIMRTSRTFRPAPVNLSPGIPTVISGAELAPYLDSRNIDFVGYSREQYERTKALPEGSYRILFTAYDYRRQDVPVSNEGSSFYYLSKNEPPLINYPACGTKIAMKTPQQIIFSWLPRNTSSPNSALETEYEFSLYETRPAGRNPNDVVLSTLPVYQVRTSFTQLIYGPAEPLLLQDIRYVWRVQAIDQNGRDAFRNNGFSEVCTFTLGGAEAGFEIGVVKDLQAEGETERRAKIWWTTGLYDSYRVEYKKTGQGFEWFQSEARNSEIKLFDLEPDTEYEVRVQARKSGYFGPYSEITKFRTQPQRILQCGETNALAQGDPGKPLLTAITGMTIDVDGMEVILIEVNPLGNGWYKGLGMVTTKLLGASFHVKFDRLFIDENRVAGFGRVDFLTRGVAELVQQQMANQKRNDLQKQQEANRQEWEGTEFHDEIIRYDDLSIESITVNDDGTLVITDNTGQTYANTEVDNILVSAPEKAVIIEDKNGDQYVVQKKDGKTGVTKVEGGGLPPLSGIPVSKDDIDLLKRALAKLKADYSSNTVNQISASYEAKKNALAEYREQVKSSVLLQPVTNTTSGIAADAMVLDWQEIQPGNDDFSKFSVSYKQAEFNYNVMKVVLVFVKETNRVDEYRLLAQRIKINEKNLSSYITDRKKEKANDDVIATEIKDSVLELIKEILQRDY